MKVIDEGHSYWKPWWVGKRATCEECGRVYELEEGDEAIVEWGKGKDQAVTIECDRCGGFVMLYREKKKSNNWKKFPTA
jgi:RNase P subunit RPR2